MCLIRRRELATWGIPKGFLDPGDTPAEAALREAYEEAGLDGRVLGDTLGSYEYWKRGSRHAVAVFMMEVQAEEPMWPEMRLRVRQWFGLEDAMSILEHHPVGSLLQEMRRRLDEANL
jgi:8-oxo-dGTP pyrophosphatase MutT (NUDIX family)